MLSLSWTSTIGGRKLSSSFWQPSPVHQRINNGDAPWPGKVSLGDGRYSPAVFGTSPHPEWTSTPRKHHTKNQEKKHEVEKQKLYKSMGWRLLAAMKTEAQGPGLSRWWRQPKRRWTKRRRQRRGGPQQGTRTIRTISLGPPPLDGIDRRGLPTGCCSGFLCLGQRKLQTNRWGSSSLMSQFILLLSFSFTYSKFDLCRIANLIFTFDSSVSGMLVMPVSAILEAGHNARFSEIFHLIV